MISGSSCHVKRDASSHRILINFPTSSASGLVYDKSSGEGILLPGIHEHMLYWQDAENKGRKGRGKGARITIINCDWFLCSSMSLGRTMIANIISGSFVPTSNMGCPRQLHFFELFLRG